MANTLPLFSQSGEICALITYWKAGATSSDDYRLTASVTIGKGPENTIKLDSPYVSTNHCKIILQNEQNLRVEDCGSTNGVSIRNEDYHSERILKKNEQAAFGFNEYLLIGDYTFIFKLEERYQETHTAPLNYASLISQPPDTQEVEDEAGSSSSAPMLRFTFRRPQPPRILSQPTPSRTREPRATRTRAEHLRERNQEERTKKKRIAIENFLRDEFPGQIAPADRERAVSDLMADIGVRYRDQYLPKKIISLSLHRWADANKET